MKRALVIVDHGSRRAEANAHVERVAAAVRERAPDLDVRVAHLELAEPSIADAIAACAAAGAEEVAVHPFFLAPGRHGAQDVPSQVEAAAADHPGVRVRLLPALGSRPEIADLVLATLRSDG